MNNRIVYACMIALVAAMLALVLAPSTARAAGVGDPTPPPRGLYVARTEQVIGTNLLSVTLSNGAHAVLKPCRFEDGRNCYWDASIRGNHRGRSLIVMKGHVFKMGHDLM